MLELNVPSHDQIRHERDTLVRQRTTNQTRGDQNHDVRGRMGGKSIETAPPGVDTMVIVRATCQRSNNRQAEVETKPPKLETMETTRNCITVKKTNPNPETKDMARENRTFYTSFCTVPFKRITKPTNGNEHKINNLNSKYCEHYNDSDAAQYGATLAFNKSDVNIEEYNQPGPTIFKYETSDSDCNTEKHTQTYKPDITLTKKDDSTKNRVVDANLENGARNENKSTTKKASGGHLYNKYVTVFAKNVVIDGILNYRPISVRGVSFLCLLGLGLVVVIVFLAFRSEKFETNAT